jgi:hypothetical protein
MRAHHYFGLLLLIGAAGCGNSRTSPVEGVVFLDGQPLANASVHFVPNETGRDATGTTNERGEFVMSTFNPRDGVVPGSYKVVISPAVGEADTRRYESAADAMAAASQATPAPKSTFPQKYTLASETPLTQEVPIGKDKLRLELTSK